MQSPSKPQLKWHGWLAGGALVLATLNCTFTYMFTMVRPPMEDSLLVYWPWLLTRQGPWAAWLFAALIVGAGLMYAATRRRASESLRRSAVNVAIVAVVAAAVPIYCGFSMGIAGRYGHLLSTTSGFRQYALGYTYEDFFENFVVCRCNLLGWDCRCHTVGSANFNQVQDSIQGLRLVPVGVGGVQYFVNDELAYTWPGDEP